MSHPITTNDLEAFLDEALPPEEMARIEQALRRDRTLLRQLTAICSRRDAGVHSLGAIWRRHRITCPTRQQLGGFLLGTLSDEQAAYIRFHLDVVGCRYCQANLFDLEQQHQESPQKAERRRRRYFESSAGYFRRSE